LEGLEAVEIRFSQLNAETRFDAEYFSKNYLKLEQQLQNLSLKTVGDFSYVTDGIHTSIDYSMESGVNLISATSPRQNSFDVSRQVFISEKAHDANPRTALKVGDVIVSTVGTVGNCAVVDGSILPANSDRHVGIVRNLEGVNPYFLSTFLLGKYGNFQTLRESTGNVQLNLFLYKIRELKVPVFSAETQVKVATAVQNALAIAQKTRLIYSEAESFLLKALGIVDFLAPTKIANIKSFKDSFASTGRLDAEYYQPKYENLLNLLRKDGLTIADVAPVRSEKFQKTPGAYFQYLEIGGLRGDGSVAAEAVACDEAPSRASQRVRQGDIITSTVRPIRRLSALVAAEQDGYVCSSGFVVLQPKQIAAEVLLVYLRLPAICELMDLHTSASLYPAISERDLLGLPIPKIPADVQSKISELVRQSFTLKAQSERLLNSAKRAVEIAIEVDEVAGMAYLARETEVVIEESSS
jgi:restriction endonuclease S subunit